MSHPLSFRGFQRTSSLFIAQTIYPYRPRCSFVLNVAEEGDYILRLVKLMVSSPSSLIHKLLKPSVSSITDLINGNKVSSARHTYHANHNRMSTLLLVVDQISTIKYPIPIIIKTRIIIAVYMVCA